MPEPAPPEPLAWTPCGDGDDCATLRVPLDYELPDGPTIGVALRRRSATDPAARIGALVVNPGGPGEAGTRLLHRDLSVLRSEVRARFDVVEMDPRGVGASGGFRCPPAAVTTLDPVPVDAPGVDALVAADRAYADACRAAAGPLLAHMGTIDVARDVEQLRRALGDDRLTFLGLSYGTLLGAVYADLFPTHVRAMVLDGALDPALDTAALSAGQAAGMQHQLDGFFAGCADRGCGWRPPKGPEPGFAALVTRLRAHPLTAADGTPVGVAELFGAAFGAMYSPDRWPALGAALAAATRGDGGPLLVLDRAYFDLEPDATFSSDASIAINCLDHPVGRDLTRVASQVRSAAALAPQFGPYLAWGSAVCAVWPASGSRTPGPVHATGAPPIVVVVTTDDPATPADWGRALAAQLADGVLLTRVGSGHVALLASDCVRARIADYLVTAVPPAVGTIC